MHSYDINSRLDYCKTNEIVKGMRCNRRISRVTTKEVCISARMYVTQERVMNNVNMKVQGISVHGMRFNNLEFAADINATRLKKVKESWTDKQRGKAIRSAAS